MGDNDHTDDNADDTVDTGDDNNDVDETVDDADTTNKNTDANDDDAGDGSSEDGNDTDGTGDSDDKSGTDTADDDDTKDDDDDGNDPESRRPKTNAEFAARRVANKQAKAAESANDKDDGNDVDDDLSTEDASAIDKRIDARLEPLLKREAENEVDMGIASFLKENPDFKPYEAKVRRWALHPSRSNLPVKSIFYEVAGTKLMTIGAKRQKAADVKAKHSQAGGGSNADTGATGNKSYKEMPLEDFGKELDDAKVHGHR